METKRINGYLFEKMLYNGLANLQSMESKLNSLNVFPVVDGDTGSNMCLTLANGLRIAKSNESLGEYLSGLNEGLLMGARGNSGVILSQIFKGIYLHLARCSAANCADMRNAFLRGYKTAYQAVVEPVEGTILTVSREGIENVRQNLDRNTTIEELFSMYVLEMKNSLERTPQLLPVLKAAGVVDSGALGYITIVEGMSKYLNGEILKFDISAKDKREAENNVAVSFDAFNENSNFDDGYCMEFILQLLSSSNYSQNFNITEFVNEMKPFGNSIAATQEKTRVKVHIHTKEPSWIIKLSQRYGEFITFKLENMQLQHNEQMLKRKNKQVTYDKPLSILAVVNGKGLEEEFKQLGCDYIIDGGPTMNTSSEEFVHAFDMLNSEAIVVLPNNKNIIAAAKQASELTTRGNIHVIETKSISEGYFAASMDIPNLNDVEKRIANIEKGMKGVTTLSVALAERDYCDERISCSPGDYIALIDDRLVFTADSPIDAFIGGLKAIKDIEEKETCVIFKGVDSRPAIEEALEEQLEDEFDLEISFSDGGQPTYLWVCGII